ncbi:unnamed protein product [Schistosoma intercalatum]|nr:unnamed protein product [Schistosoma intercalatum]
MMPGGESGDDKDTKQKEDVEKRNQEIRASILAQILDQDARARLNTIAITKPEKAKMVENMLINMAQTGRLGPKCFRWVF